MSRHIPNPVARNERLSESLNFVRSYEMSQWAEENLVLGGIEGKNLDALARTLVDETPERRRQNDLRYVLERALNILDQEVSGKGIE